MSEPLRVREKSLYRGMGHLSWLWGSFIFLRWILNLESDPVWNSNPESGPFWNLNPDDQNPWPVWNLNPESRIQNPYGIPGHRPPYHSREVTPPPQIKKRYFKWGGGGYLLTVPLTGPYSFTNLYCPFLQKIMIKMEVDFCSKFSIKPVL